MHLATKACTFIFSSLGVFSPVAALDWGKMSQYNSTLQTLPTLSGNTIWLSGTEGEGFEIVLSQDAQAKVEGVLEGCDIADNQCYQDILATIQSAAVDLDQKLDKRAFGKQLLKIVKGPWDIFFNIASMLYVNWGLKTDKMENSAFFLPQSKAEEAAESATSTSVVQSAGGSVVVTITPTPNPTTLTGSAAPSITTATVAASGHEKGDLLALLDSDLADKINEIAHRMTNCADGQQFDASHESRRRGVTATYGEALCAAEGVISMAGKGGPLADLTLLDHDQIGMQFAANAEKAKDALLVLTNFISAYSAVFAIPEQSMEQLATYILALIIDSLVVNEIAIGEINYIGQELAVTYGAMEPKPKPPATPTTASVSSSSSSGCPDPTKTPISCGQEDGDCNVKFPDPKATQQKEPVCADSKWKGCKCNPPVITYDNVVGADELRGMQTILQLFQDFRDHPIQDASVTCLELRPSAPRSDKDAKGAVSVEAAVNTWCRDNHGKSMDDLDLDVSWRWPVTKLGVPNRNSFWLQAAKRCDDPETFDRWECKKSLLDGMKECGEEGNELTHGVKATGGCLDYSIRPSYMVDTDQPPWHETKEKRKFPPPENAEKKGGNGDYKPICNKGNGERPLSDDDLNKAIDWFCQDGKEPKGFGQYSEEFKD